MGQDHLRDLHESGNIILKCLVIVCRNVTDLTIDFSVRLLCLEYESLDSIKDEYFLTSGATVGSLEGLCSIVTKVKLSLYLINLAPRHANV
jgi:hypothetical protein